MRQAFKSILNSVAVSKNKTAVLQGCTQLKEILKSGTLDDDIQQLQYCRDKMRQLQIKVKNNRLTEQTNKKLFWGHVILGILGIGVIVAVIL